LLLVDLECVTVLHLKLMASGQQLISTKETRLVGAMYGSQRKLVPTDSGLSVGFTRWPSNRNRTLCRDLPCRSQKASINFLSWVVRLILKNTSLFESVTLMFRCSGCSSGFGPLGEPESDILISTKVFL